MPVVDVGLILTAVNNAAAGLTRVSDDVKKIGTNAQATENRLKAIQVVIAGIAIEKIRQMADMFLKAAAATQSLDLHLAAFAGGVGPASQIWSKLNNEFGATPFKIDGITTAWIKLQAVTGNNSESTRIIEAVVNAIAAMPDGTDAKIQDITVALQRMLATGKAEGRQFKSIITDAGLTVGDLAKAAGRGTAEFNRALNDGFVNSKTLIDAFVKASNDKFGNFAIKLGSTLGGSMRKIENDFSAGLSRLGERTDINDRLTQTFQNLDKSVMSFMDHINQGDIDNFFNLLANVEPVVEALVHDVKNIAMAFLGLTNVTAHLLDMLPPEATEYGIIGYAIFGKKGLGIGLLIGWLDHGIRGLLTMAVQGMAAIGLISKSVAKGLAEDWSHSTIDNIATLLGGGATVAGAGGIFSKDKAVTDKIRRDLEAISNTKPNVVPVGGDTDQLTKALEAAARLADQLEDSFNSIVDNVNILNSQTSGDELGAHLEEINKKTDAWLATITKAINDIDKVEPGAKTKDLLNLEAALKAEVDNVNDARDRALLKESQLFDLKTKTFLLDQRLSQFGLADQFAHMQQQFNTSPGFNIFGGSNSANMQLMQTEFDLRTQILEISKAQADLDQQILELGGPDGPQGDKVDALEKTKRIYGELSDLARQSLNDLTIEGTLSKQFWTDIGTTMHSTIADGLDGIIERTKTWGDVGRAVLSALTKLSINYLLSLAEAKLQQNALSDGNIFGGLGNLIHNIPHFANGGVVSGPTLIGEAGGDGEGVLPLTRIGGKLGVRSEGGGNTYNISISAIDTQTGMQFIGQHIANIDRGIQHRRTLNRRG